MLYQNSDSNFIFVLNGYLRDQKDRDFYNQDPTAEKHFLQGSFSYTEKEPVFPDEKFWATTFHEDDYLFFIRNLESLLEGNLAEFEVEFDIYDLIDFEVSEELIDVASGFLKLRFKKTSSISFQLHIESCEGFDEYGLCEKVPSTTYHFLHDELRINIDHLREIYQNLCSQ